MADKATEGHSPLVTPTQSEAPTTARETETAPPGRTPFGKETDRHHDTPTGKGTRTNTNTPTGTPDHTSPLLPHDESDKLTTRLHQAVATFVDEPRTAVEEADRVLEEAATRFADALKQRRGTLRTSWETGNDKAATAADTEQLRLVLRDYRELAERLLRG
ncbi:hypothetical protein [Streptomyces sp. SID13726]|uniref:hypothetical protein n=1 Tax=Streptomyces sp. SID13726 TaxID=2706058 RepID=UPI0019450936|nr:hypothetical protein [Streptomyces sp. SID13726]